MSTMKAMWDCMFSPKLIKIYGNGPVEKIYHPTVLEKWGDQVIQSLYIIWKLGVYTSPLLAGILYQREYFTSDGLVSLTKFVTSIGVILVVSYCCRSLGRCSNPTYKKFLVSLQKAKQNPTPATKQNITVYDFEFYAWPVDFDFNKSVKSPIVRKSITAPGSSLISNVLNLPFKVAAAVAMHTFGIRLLYPGSISFLQLVLGQALLQGRSRLVENARAERNKVRTRDNNEIDTMLVDRRDKFTNGNILVVCCEGNAGFYEIGIMSTPIEAGYSVLGWNHPGFGGSTGTPYPTQEQNAVDAVMQFAIVKLGFKIENIIIFAWSIGGYTATWAAMNYPDIKGLVLDATFDDVLPLAVTHMPSWIEPIVKIAIREHVNLNVAEQLTKYPGPVLLIRRTEDEVISLREDDLTSNRGNDLLKKVLSSRYPLIFDSAQVQVLDNYLELSSVEQAQFVDSHGVQESVCYSLLQSYISEYSNSFPLKIGEDFTVAEKNQMTLYLAQKYMIDFKSNHCTNLPAEMFRIPWVVNVESDFVFT